MAALLLRAVAGPVRGLHTTAVVCSIRPGPLTAATVAQFKKDGFVLCKDLLSAEEKKSVVSWTNELQSWPDAKGKWMRYYEPVKVGGTSKEVLCRMENFLDYHAALKTFITVKLNAAVGQLFGEDSVLFKEKINFKLAGASGFKPHQDAPAWTTFHQERHITAMVAVDPATVENGCMYMVRGEHTKGTFPNVGGVMSEEYCKRWHWEPLVCDAGDVAFFDSYVPHRSFDNKSDKSRRVYYITYNPTVDGDYREAYYEDKRKNFPPQNEREPGKDYSKGAEVYNVGNPIPVKN
jgi:hypothetical protein